jgi:DNA primase
LKNRIPDSVIDDIRSRSDIAEKVSQTVALKKAGKYLKGLCPFHSEKTPSFTVSPDKQIYYCFGCGAGGNIFKFLMETEEISFLDAVKKLAEEAGVDLPSVTPDAPPGERDVLFRLNRLATEYFQRQLNDTEAGLAARQYAESRSLDADLLEKYQIGWASPGWRGLSIELQKTARCKPELLEKAGLIRKKDGGSEYYDRFRGRLIFPLKDAQGRIIGFAGRSLKEEDSPKYLNSPETLLYKKGSTLFGIDGAREAIRRRDNALIVEGYFDQIRAHQFGIKNAVAACGTALTAAQALLLKHLTANVTLIFDADPAGQAAARKGFEILLEQGINVKIAVLPAGQDPDSFILDQGPEAFLQYIETARPYIESYIHDVIRTGDITSPGGRVEVVNQVLPLLLKVKNQIERSEWVRYFSEHAGVEDKALLNELKKAMEQNQEVLPPQASSPAGSRLEPEFYLAQLALTDDDAAALIRREISLEEIPNGAFRQILGLIYETLDQAAPLKVDRLLDKLDEPESRAWLSRMGMKPIAFDSPEKATRDCIREIKRKNIESSIEELKQQRREAEKAGESDRSRALHTRLREMRLSLGAWKAS